MQIWPSNTVPRMNLLWIFTILDYLPSLRLRCLFSHFSEMGLWVQWTIGGKNTKQGHKESRIDVFRCADWTGFCFSHKYTNVLCSFIFNLFTVSYILYFLNYMLIVFDWKCFTCTNIEYQWCGTFRLEEDNLLGLFTALFLLLTSCITVI
jgi:hypothetical protein